MNCFACLSWPEEEDTIMKQISDISSETKFQYLSWISRLCIAGVMIWDKARTTDKEGWQWIGFRVDRTKFWTRIRSEPVRVCCLNLYRAGLPALTQPAPNLVKWFPSCSSCKSEWPSIAACYLLLHGRLLITSVFSFLLSCASHSHTWTRTSSPFFFFFFLFLFCWSCRSVSFFLFFCLQDKHRKLWTIEP